MGKSFCLFLVVGIAALLPASEATAAAKSKTTTLVIQGMVTNNCPVLVKTALSKVDGVLSVDANLKTKQVVVTYRDKVTDPKAMVRVIKDDVGFDAKVIRRATIAIGGMVTANCPVLVKTAVGKIKGVVEVQADLKTKTATVDFIEGVTSVDQILAVIKNDVGFAATCSSTL